MHLDDTSEHETTAEETGTGSPQARDGEATEARFEQVVDLPTSIDAVWEAITDPAELAHWLGSSVELDVRPGGRGRIVDDDGTVREVVVTDVRYGEQIAWHWWSDRGDLSSVELRVAEHDGHARLRIVESTLIAAAANDAMRADKASIEMARAHVARCTRHWAVATSRLWRRVGVAAFA
jgi:uncharacterized protein YndB with AHSA1/START domain